MPSRCAGAHLEKTPRPARPDARRLPRREAARRGARARSSGSRDPRRSREGRAGEPLRGRLRLGPDGRARAGEDPRSVCRHADRALGLGRRPDPPRRHTGSDRLARQRGRAGRGAPDGTRREDRRGARRRRPRPGAGRAGPRELAFDRALGRHRSRARGSPRRPRVRRAGDPDDRGRRLHRVPGRRHPERPRAGPPRAIRRDRGAGSHGALRRNRPRRPAGSQCRRLHRPGSRGPAAPVWRPAAGPLRDGAHHRRRAPRRRRGPRRRARARRPRGHFPDRPRRRRQGALDRRDAGTARRGRHGDHGAEARSPDRPSWSQVRSVCRKAPRSPRAREPAPLGARPRPRDHGRGGAARHRGHPRRHRHAAGDLPLGHLPGHQGHRRRRPRTRRAHDAERHAPARAGPAARFRGCVWSARRPPAGRPSSRRASTGARTCRSRCSASRTRSPGSRRTFRRTRTWTWRP